jgi:hypothetical protein
VEIFNDKAASELTPEKEKDLYVEVHFEHKNKIIAREQSTDIMLCC